MPNDADSVGRYLDGANRAIVEAARKRGAMRAGLVVQREAVRNAPRSPTEAQKRAEKKSSVKPAPHARRRSLVSRLVHKAVSAVKRMLKRRRRGRARAVPGGLEKSIEIGPVSEGCSIFVASNSPAGKYAKRMHDEKGKTWWNRGPGTRSKGTRADEKFIDWAIEASKDLIGRIIEDEVKKVQT